MRTKEDAGLKLANNQGCRSRISFRGNEKNNKCQNNLKNFFIYFTFIFTL